MGGDHGLSVTVPAALSFLQSHPGHRLLLVGREPEVAAALTQHGQRHPYDKAAVEIRHAAEVVGMDEGPAQALRSKRQSSMRIAIELVKSGEADAAISAGNTGALMAISRFVLKMLEGIERPAIAFQVPNQKGGTTTVLDLGANVDCEPQHFLQFAIMGAALVTALDGKASPSIGLLNIGEEAIKGNETVKQAAELLRASGLNFHGNVEGNDIYGGVSDVVVCDGFVGNVMLKTSEGMASMLAEFIRQEFTRGPLSKLAALVAMPVLQRFKRRVDPRRYNGAALLGLRGLVFKSHGSADALAFETALLRAYDAARHGLLDRVHDRIAQTMQSIPNVADGAAPAASADPARRVA